ncbi:thiamine transport system permease protein [Nocardioides albertanoniae]|uniref:Thiamine transport system permease protein n=1 Tax=Nocardioides albertanoniae TaxID=1175486 RepID=A0A543A1W2_9ACTN|nr:ABC transporter permease subunit [Nocardioides albertanoniae]TQL66572.1 thiamine transport system permease protein [Nocardioides albertanoniae]
MTSRLGSPTRRAVSGRIGTLIALAAIPVAVLAVFFVLPVTGMVQRGFMADGAFDPAVVIRVLERSEIQRALWFTLWSSGLATMLSVALGLPAAFALSRLSFPLQRVIRAGLLVPFVLPTVVVGVAFRELIGEAGVLAFLGLDGTPTAIILGLVFFNASVVIRAVGAAWESLDPRPGEAASALGAGPVRVFMTITLPALRPAIVSAASVVFLFCATAFGIVLTLGGVRYNSIETEIYKLTFTLFDLPGAAVLSVLQLVVVVGLLVVAGRLRAVPDPAQSRVVVRRRRVSLRDLPVLASTAVLVLLVAGPMLALLLGSLRVDDRWSLANYVALQTPGFDPPLPVPVTQALVTSLAVAVQAALVALALGLLVAFAVTRRSRTRGERRVRAVLDGLFMVPLGVSAVTLGLGLYLTLGSPPLDLRDAPWLVPLAQALVALPLVVRTLVPVLGSVDDRLRQAAAGLGAGPLRTVMTVDAPAVWKPLLASSGFAFAASLGEFGATSFLVREERPTLPVVILRLLSRPGSDNYGMALAAACVLAVATAAVMLLVERLRVPSIGAL